MTEEIEKRTDKDSNNLSLLSVFHYVLGIVGLFFSFFPLIHVFIGWMILHAPEKMAGKTNTPPPAVIGWILLIAGVILIIVGLSLSICMLLSGRYLSRCKNYRFSFVVACIECLCVPVGTILGIFTIIVLQRDSVKELYKSSRAQISPSQ